MSLIAARKKRTTLYLSIAGLMVMVAAISAISARDPSGVSLRVGMIMVTVGAALWLPWRQLVPVVLLAWLVPNLARNFVDDTSLLNLNMALELPGLAGVAFFTVMAREALKNLEQENVLIGSGHGDLAGFNAETAIFEQSQLQPMLHAELARSRRFGRPFALVLVGIDEMRQKFDYRDDALWRASLDATSRLLRETRQNVDRVFHYRNDGFAIILPESSEKDIPGLVKRLRRLARQMKPAEAEAGGPLPVHFGATFFPDCATTVDDLLRRAEVALKIATSTTTRYQLDSAEAPELPPAETLRRENAEPDAETLSVPPPSVSSPVAAALVDEAYAERTRESATAGETLEAAGPVMEIELPEAPSASDEPVVLLAAMTEEPAEALEVEVPVPVVIADAPDEVVTSMPYDLQYEQVETRTAEPEPVQELVASVAGSVGYAPSELDEAPVMVGATVSDDFETLLKQMDETLKMIKSVRSQAA